jgi:hypothetical protein
MATSTEHKLKCWPVFFDAIERNIKNFDVRKDDRGYQKGDWVVFEKYDPVAKAYFRGADPMANMKCRRKIKYIQTGGQFGIEAGYVILGLGR